MNNPIIMHCNYAEQGQSLDAMCALAAKLGFDGVEFRRKRASVPQPATEYLDEIEAAVKKHKINKVMFGAPGPNLVLPDADERNREVDEVASFYRDAAKRFDLDVCNLMCGTLATEGVDYMEFDKHGSNIATDAHWDAAVEGMQILGDLASELGFRFAFETHNVYLHDLPAPTRKLIDLIDRDSIGANLDFGNILLHPEGCTLAESFDILKGKIYLLHLKNLILIPQRKYYKWIACRLGEGAINNREYLQLAKAQGYDGPVGIEAPAPGDREWFARVDIEYIKTVMAEL